ncbi:hypothetical protein GCM10027088_74740 [Nocardia goodfellowii]
MCESWEPVYEIDGRVVDPGRLYRVRGGGWAEPAPVACPGGHPFGAGKVLVGSLACQAVGGSHRLHTCIKCGYVVHTPPMRPDCDHPVTRST